MCKVIISAVLAFGFLFLSLYFHSIREYKSEHQSYLIGLLFAWFACWTIIRYFKKNKSETDESL